MGAYVKNKLTDIWDRNKVISIKNIADVKLVETPVWMCRSFNRQLFIKYSDIRWLEISKYMVVTPDY